MRKLYKRTKWKFFSPLFLCLGFAANAQIGQSYFKYVSPAPTGVLYNSVSFFDNNNGIAVGYYGGIAKTTDGGATWNYGVFTFVNNNGFTTKPTFWDCQFVTATIAYAVGEWGIFLKSTDGGATWNRVNNPYITTATDATTRYPASVFFTSATRGFMGGSPNTGTYPFLYTTLDGGNTWDSIPAPFGDTTLMGAVASPVKHQINSGTKSIRSIRFSSNNVGFISGTGGAGTNLPTGVPGGTASGGSTLLWKYENGTLKDYSVSKEKLYGHWLPPATGNFSAFTGASQNYWAMTPANDSIVILASQNNSYVYRVFTGINDSINDFVHTGKKVAGRYELISGAASTGGTPPTNPAAFAGSGNMWKMAKGPDGKIYVPQSNGGIMAYTADNGATWSRMFVGTASFGLLTATVTPNGRIFSMGSGGFVTDSLPGQARRTVHSYFATQGYSNTNDMEFADCDNAVAAGGNKSLAASIDGGRTWIDKTNAGLPANFSFYGLSYKNPTKLYLSGTASGANNSGLVYSSADKGTTLDLILNVSAYNGFNPVVFGIDNIGDTIWATGRIAKTSAPASYTANVYRSFNAGLSWDTITVETGTVSANTISSAQVKFTSKDTGYYFGIGSFSVSGKIFKTTNAGATWTNITPTNLPAGAHNWVNMSVVGKDTLFVCGYAGNVYKSFNAGATWTAVPIVISTEELIGNLTNILFHDSRNGYATGNGGRIFITNDGGATWRVDHTPNNNIFLSIAFTAQNTPAGTPFVNRKVLIGGTGVPTGGAEFYEYGNPLTIDIQSTENVVNTNCSNANAGSITVNATGGIAPYTYSINGGAFQTSNVFAGLSQGAKNITIKESGCGRTFTKTVNISFTNNLTLTASNDTTVCAGAPVQLQAVSIAGASFSWTPATGLNNAAIANPIATPTQTTNYTVTATLGACTATKPVVITIKPSPAVSAGPDRTIVSGDQVTLQGAATNASSIAWTPAATLTNATTLTPVARPATTTTYTLTVRNTDNCTSTDDVVVNVIPYCVKVMNAFTPNGDGMNDRWKVTDGNSCTSQVEVAVYNRYGSSVYKNTGYNNDWDGTYNGKPLPDGTYYYRITLHLINGTITYVNGDVTILR